MDNGVDPPRGLSYAAPLIDFTPLGNLQDRYYKGAEQQRQYNLARVFQDGGVPTDPATGIVDYRAITQKLAQAGANPEQVLSAAGQILPQQLQIGAMRDLDLLPGTQQPTSAMPPRAAAPTLPQASPLGGAANASAPRGIRNNNPGNIRDGAFAQSQPGYLGADPQGFARFETSDHGMAAASANLAAYGRRGVVTPATIAARWAPAGDGNNNPAVYGKFLADKLGVAPDTPIDLTDPAMRQQVAAAIGQFENGPQAFARSQEPQSTDISAAGAQPRGAARPNGSTSAISDPTLGGLVPVEWARTGRTAGEFVDFLEKKARAASVLGKEGLAKNYQGRADAVRDVLKASVEPTPDMKNASSVGLDVLDYHRQLKEAEKGGSTEAQIAERKKAAISMGLDPKDPRTETYILTGKHPREDQLPLTATDKKAILEADEQVLASRNVISNLDEAIKLNSKAFTGFTAGFRAWLGNNIPDKLVPDFVASPEGAAATKEYDNLVLGQALTQLKSIFGAAPTEGERKILLELQASASLPEGVRVEILARAKRMAEARLKFNEERAGELRGGTYYRPGDRKPAEQRSDSAPAGALAVGAVVDGYRYKGGDPSVPSSWEQTRSATSGRVR